MTSMDAGCLSRRRHSGPRCCWQRSAQIGTIQANFYGVIVTALNDGFCADILEAARHFYEIDPERQRAANLWGILLMEEGRLDEAETRPSGNTARAASFSPTSQVFAKRRGDAKAERTLWHPLESDPNQSNGLRWYHALHRERGGNGAWIDTLPSALSCGSRGKRSAPNIRTKRFHCIESASHCSGIPF